MLNSLHRTVVVWSVHSPRFVALWVSDIMLWLLLQIKMHCRRICAIRRSHCAVKRLLVGSTPLQNDVEGQASTICGDPFQNRILTLYEKNFSAAYNSRLEAD